MNDGGPAFPTLKTSLMRDHRRESDRYTTDYNTDAGMSLRDYFAGCALTGLFATARLRSLSAKEVSVRAYRVADAMLAERSL